MDGWMDGFMDLSIIRALQQSRGSKDEGVEMRIDPRNNKHKYRKAERIGKITNNPRSQKAVDVSKKRGGGDQVS